MKQITGAHFVVALKKSEIKRQKYEGREYIVVPVIMAKSDVVMNDAVLPESEYFPDAWNGVPVTVGHPSNDDGSFLSANSPKTLTEWAIGRIFNVRVEDGALRAEAWIEVARANKVYPDLVQRLVDGDQIDVSTGYFADSENSSGVLFGQDYHMIHKNVRPDHLAFLPDEEGACNWEDGCGIRANKRNRPVDIKSLDVKLPPKFTEMLTNFKKSVDNLLSLSEETQMKINCKCGHDNARGKDNDPRQIVADLISMDASPFLPDDMYGLNSLSPDTLATLAEAYRPSKGKSNAAAEEPAQPGEETVKAEEVQAMIDQAVTKAVAALSTNAKPAELSVEDKAALAFAHKVTADHRAGLVKKITANSKLTEEGLKAFTTEQLETLAAGINEPAPVVNYGGRPVVVDTRAGDGDEDMAPPTVFSNLRKKKEAA